MNYLLACIPIAAVVALMIGLRWGADKAGAAGLLTSAVVGAFAFGLTPEVFWVSQLKGALLSLYVLAVMWPALFLFHWLNSLGAIKAAASALDRLVPDRPTCALAMAWCLSGAFEGVAGFGIPIAIVSPMLVASGTRPVRAVAAVAIGHSWAVTFGSMGLIFQTLITITGMSPGALAPWTALLLGIACIGCGFGAAAFLGLMKRWRSILFIGIVMAAVQYLLCASSALAALGSLGAGTAGLAAAGAILRLKRNAPVNAACETAPSLVNLRPALACYGALALALGLLTFAAPVRQAAEHFHWKTSFAAVSTKTGFVTAPGSGPVFRPFTHPGSLIAMVSVLAVLASFSLNRPGTSDTLRKALVATVKSGGLATVGVVLMVGMAAVMDHCGMTLLLAKAVTGAVGAGYPVVSPVIGVLGAFATGSNNNSNIMFATLQQNAAALLQISPALVLAGQTTGGSLGSMVAPAKLAIGCSTVGLAGHEGLVLRKTLVPLLLIVLVAGLILLALGAR